MRTLLIAVLTVVVWSPAWGQTATLERARRHFEAGSKAFSEGRFPAAEVEFRAAFAITKDPLLHYNIAQSQQRRGHIDAAIRSYRAYLKGVPTADDRADVEKTIEKLEAELVARQQTPPPKAAVAVKPTAAPPPVRVAAAPTDARRQSAWVTGGASVAVLAAAIAMSVTSASSASDANALLDQRTADGGPVPFWEVENQYNSAKDDAALYGGVAIGLYAAAAVGAAVSTYLYLTSGKYAVESDRNEARLRLMPTLTPQSAGLVAGVEF